MQKSVLAPSSWRGAVAQVLCLPIRWVLGILVGLKVLLLSWGLVFLFLLKSDDYEIFLRCRPHRPVLAFSFPLV